VTGKTRRLLFSVFLGFKGKGVFAGSRVTSAMDDQWEHAVIEASRNLKNFELSGSIPTPDASIIAQRVNYFGAHSDHAVLQIERAKKEIWPKAKMELNVPIETGIVDVFLHRSLCTDFVFWHLGDEKRFVY
jgi:hypothetical protein